MGFFNKINKVVKSTLDINLEKEAKELISDSIGDIKNNFSDILDLEDIKGSISNSLKSLKKTKNSISDMLDLDNHNLMSSIKENITASIKDTELGKYSSMLGLLGSKGEESSATKPMTSGKGNKTYNTLFSTACMKRIAEAYKETIEVDEDGDVKATFSQANGKAIRWYKWYQIYPDHITVSSGSYKYPANFNAKSFADGLNSNPKFKDVISVRVDDDNTIFLAAKMKSTDIESFCKELLNINMMLNYTWQFVAEDIEKEASAICKFSTKMVSKLLDIMNTNYSVDDEGDIKAEYLYAAGKRANWFAWYLISPTEVTIDTGSTDLHEDFDIETFKSELEKNKSVAERFSVRITDNGSMRIKSVIKASTPEETTSTWNLTHELLEIIWGGISEQSEHLRRKEQEEEEKRRSRIREEEQYSNSDDEDNEVENANDSDNSHSEFKMPSFDFFNHSTRSSSSGSSDRAAALRDENRKCSFQVKNGWVHCYNEYGVKERAPFRPSAGGDAIFVDYSPTLDRLLVTTKNGTIAQYSPSGGQLTAGFTVKDAVMARWQGNDIYIQTSDGKSRLYWATGGVKRWY